MIVEVDFLKHWKTQMLIDELKDKCAPLYVLAIWAHCQVRKSDVIPEQPSAIKAICGYEGDGEVLKSALISSGFLDQTIGGLTAHDWSATNSKLVANWVNGKKHKGKSEVGLSQPEPNDNPNENWDNPNPSWVPSGLTDREEKIDKKEKIKKKEASAEGLKFAQWFKTIAPADVNQVASWEVNWGCEYDKLLRLDGKTKQQVKDACQWARGDQFWSKNFQTPMKLRERNNQGVMYIDVFIQASKPDQQENGGYVSYL